MDSTTTTGMSQGRIKLKQEKVTEARPSQGYAKPWEAANLPDAANREDVAKTNESDIYIPGETRRDETRTSSCSWTDGLSVERSANLRTRTRASPSILLSLYEGDQDLCSEENLLRSFDLNSRFGPCTGVSRLERWERAQGLGLNPPNEVRDLLLRQEVNPNSLWQGRV